MKTHPPYPAPLARLQASMLASDVSQHIFDVRKNPMPRFNLWFERDCLKAYVRYVETIKAGTNDERVMAICLANVVVFPKAQHMGVFTKLLEELENKAYIHGCQFYVESVVTNWVMHTCAKRRYKAYEQHDSGVFDYWFLGPCELQLAPPDLFAAQEGEELYKELGGKT